MRTFFYGLLAVSLALPAIAQQETDQPGDRPGGRRAVRRGPEGGPPRARIAQMAERLAEQLQLDPEQRALFDAIVDRHQKQAAESGADGAKWREIADEMRTARRDGDTERVRELAAQMREMGGGGRQAMNDFFDEVGTILTDEQSETLGRFRERAAERGRRGRGDGPGGPRQNFGRMARELRDELDLDSAQTEQFDGIVTSMRENDDRGALFREMREARDSGDDERAQELRDQLREMRGDPQEQMAKFFSELEAILRDDQKAVLAEYRERMDTRAPAGRGDDPRNIVRAAKRLKLTEQQQQDLTQIEREMQEALREMRGRDRAQRGEFAEKLKTEIEALLDKTQVEEFHRNLERFAPDRGRGDRERDRNRDGSGRRRPRPTPEDDDGG